MDYIYYLLFALILSLILSQTRFSELSPTLGTIISTNVAWCIVIYGIILGFSISNFYNKYILVRDTFVKEATNIKLTYQIFKQLPSSEERDNVLKSIEKYVISVKTTLVKSLANYEYDKTTNALYNQMNKEIINYVNTYPSNVFNNNILLRLSTSDYIKQITNEMNSSKYYITLLWFLLIFVIFPLWLIVLKSKLLQFTLDFSLLVILLSCIYLCDVLSNPFVNSPISIKLQIFNDLLD